MEAADPEKSAMPSTKSKCVQCGRELHIELLIDTLGSCFGSSVRQVCEGDTLREEIEAYIDAEVAEKGGTILVNCHRPDGPERSLPELRQIEVKVPPGVATGSRLRLRGAGNGGCDLYVLLRVDAAKPRLCIGCQAQQGRPKVPVVTAIIGLTVLVVLGLLRGCTRLN